MWRKFTIYFVIIVLIKLCRSHHFLIINKYEGARFYCITNSSFALSWILEDTFISTDLHQVSTFLPKPQRLWNIGDEMEKNKWTHKTTFSEEIILDRRWERMKIYKTDYVEDNTNSKLNFTTVDTSLTTNFFIPFSLRTKYEAHIFLCDGDDVIYSNCYWFLFLGFFGTKSAIRKCPQETVPPFNARSVKTPCKEFIVERDSSSQFLNGGSWSHFTLSKVDNTLALALPNGTHILSYSDTRNVFNVKYLMIHSKRNIGLWKFHEIDYYSTADEKEMQFQKPIQVIDESICISMFAQMCESCTIKLEISSRDFPNITESQIFTHEGSGWQAIKFEKVNISSDEIYLTLTTINRRDSNPYWKIGDITQCGIKNFRMIQLSELADCQLVSNKTETISLYERNQVEESRSLESHKCRENEIGRYCIPCRWFIDDKCNHPVKICERFRQNTYCSCSPGYQLFKNEIICSKCDYGYYGYFCEDKCSKHCTNCGNVDGTCSSCTENNSGPKCDIPPIYFKEAPSLKDVGYTSVSIILNNFDLSRNTKAESYVVQYKRSQDQTQKWKTLEKVEKIGQSKTIQIDDLKPGRNYSLRSVIVMENSFYERDEIPVLHFSTKCNAVTEKDFIVMASNTSTIIFVPEKSWQWVCRFKISSVELTNPSVTKDFACNYPSCRIMLENLKPFQQYEVLIKTDFNEIRKVFITKEGIPEKVSNLRATTGNTNVRLAWTKPKEIKGNLTHYTVKYKIKNYNGCGKAVPDCCEKTVTVTQENIVLSDLNPYTTMLFSVSAANAKFKGIPEEIVLNIPVSDFIHDEEIPNFQLLKVEARSAYLQFSSLNCTKMRGPLVIMLNAICSEEWCKNITVTKEKNSAKVKLSDLSVFTDYTLQSKFCRSNTNCIKMERFSFQTQPESPSVVRNFIVYTKNGNSISLRWMPPFPPTGILEGYNIKYSIDYIDPISENITTTLCSLWKEFLCFTLTNLRENKNYFIDIMAINKMPKMFGQQKSIRTVTKKEQPGQPPDLKINWTLQNDLKISWHHPIEANGYIERFYITVLTTIPNDTLNIRQTLNVTEKDYRQVYLHNIKAENLLESTEYKIAVRAYNGFDGKSSSLEIFSPPDIPLFNREPTFKLSNNTIEIKTSEIKNLKENDTYKVYLLIPSDEIDAFTRPQELKHLETNFDIKTSHLRIAYKCLYKTIKNSKTQNSNKECEQKFCAILNGSAQNVTILLVHTDSNDQNSYKLYSFAEDKPEVIDSARDLSWFALLLLLLLIPTAIIIYRKRYVINEKITSFKENMFGTSSPDVESPTEAVPLMASSLRPEVKNSKIYSKKVPLKQFEQYVKESLSNGELERQHALLPRGQTNPWECGALPENKSKNRYTNLMAYDHTRVVLATFKNRRHSDYINANYIHGYKVPKAYIATQGPKKTTIGDFWRMIWQENVRHIAMLANTFEAGKKKCEKYWPDKNATTCFENILVHFISIQVFADYQHRIFDVVCNNERRTINQYHFFSWPDYKNVPLDPQSLVPFLQNLQKITPDSKSPIVVHCSGGVGRTGTIILCDICLKMAAEETAVDVLSVFQKLRDQRPNMVDNIQQYKLTHLVILKYLLGTKTGENEYFYPLLNFSNNQKYENTTVSDLFSKRVDLVDFEEYIKKAEISGEFTVQHDMVKKYQNSVNYTEVRHNQYFDYVDIVFSKDHILPKVYILADVRKIDSTNEFWKIIWEENVRHIIFLASKKEQTPKQFYPNSDEKMECSSISVQAALSKPMDNYTERTFILINNGEIRLVNQIEFAYQGQNPLQFVSFFKKMSTFPLSSSSPIFIQSNDMERSGFILLCEMCLRMAEKEQATDVWKKLKQLSDRRMDIFCNMALYKLAHLVVLKTIFSRKFEDI